MEKSKSHAAVRRTSPRNGHQGGPRRVNADILSSTDPEKIIDLLMRRQDELQALNEDLGRSQSGLEEACQKYMRLYDVAPVGFLTLGPFGQILELNPQAAWILGRRAELVLHTALGLYGSGPEQFQALFKHLEECAKSGKSRMTELELSPPGGPPRLVHAFTQIISSKPIRYLTVLTDVTEQRLADERIQWQASLLNLTHTGIICRDERGRVTYWNRAAEDMYGFSEAEALGQDLFSLLRTQFPESKEAIANQLARHGRWEGELKQQNKRSEAIVVEGRWVVHKPSRKGASFILESHSDITARKAAEAAMQRAQADLEHRVELRTTDLQRTNDQLQQEMRVRRELERQFLSAVDDERRRIGQSLHDNLGQQLVGSACLIKNLELELSDAKLPQARQARRIGVMINRAIAQMRAVSRGLTFFAMPEKELAPALRNMAQNVQSLTGVACRAQYGAALLRLPLGGQMINHLYCVAQEAVTNALKHGAPQSICLRLSQKRGWLYLRVTNDGRPPRERAQNGIGLRIMKHRASLLGGRVTLQAGLQGGAELTCAVPLDRPIQTKPKRG